MKLPAFKLERFFAKYEFKAPYLLSSSDCEAMTIEELLSLEPDATQRFHQTWLGYTETQGNPELRQVIAQTYQTIGIENTLVHAGAEEAVFIFMNVALQPGDHLIVHFPCYQSHSSIAQSIGCEVSWWMSREADSWELDLDWLRGAIQPNTKAIVINCPHNPTGYVMSRAKLEELIVICRKHKLLLFSDEVYRFLEYRDEDTLPAACDLYENAVSLGVMSKAYGLAGLRIGWIATHNQEIYQAMAEFKDFTSICSSAPSEFLSTLALRNRDKIIQRNRAIIAANIEICNGFFSRYADFFNWTAPKGGSTAFPSLRQAENVEEFCINLVNQQGVLLLPSTYFDYGEKNFRIGLGRRNLPECVDKLDNYLKASAASQRPYIRL
ncbi:aminotransferase class I/II-fold pyridoxal phosphate-dependent enzyme [Oscillatoria sp. CS-180]|uniref:aminotransferase class I/II-fold pyridoxal phosphate-dependent enzyme n=1 Tax=Oscillatoria sp. CS-180 TaxID=3021720 RepID=UPI00232B4CBB|nr:aminotransferase class I/II-fold pyridoxal phosphate-dependent enzyme [Oscillatoria sp. CS-180]MDB9526601.1 aminotransferase class I/II-fold pyridoxal phosphate-dependent enzyme [Oscillatoria sp. CS-180]